MPKAGVVFKAALCLAVFALGTTFASERPPGQSPTRIEVSFYLIDLMRVIDRDEAFEADLFALARWKDPRLRGESRRVVPAEEVWTPNVVVFNERAVSSRLPRVVEIDPDGTVTFRQRLIGTFSSPLDLRRFPMDRQTLEVRLVAYGYSSEEVLLVESPAIPSLRAQDLTIGDWAIGDLETEAATFTPVPGFELSSLTARIPARRLTGYYVVQLLVPLLLIVSMSWIPFWIQPGVVNIRVSIAVTTVLTLIAYRFMVGALTPRLSYLTRFDLLLLGSTALVALALACAVAGTYLTNRDRTAAVARMDLVARAAFPIGFALLLASVAWLG